MWWNSTTRRISSRCQAAKQKTQGLYVLHWESRRGISICWTQSWWHFANGFLDATQWLGSWSFKVHSHISTKNKLFSNLSWTRAHNREHLLQRDPTIWCVYECYSCLKRTVLMAPDNTITFRMHLILRNLRVIWRTINAEISSLSLRSSCVWECQICPFHKADKSSDSALSFLSSWQLGIWSHSLQTIPITISTHISKSLSSDQKLFFNHMPGAMKSWYLLDALNSFV